jgi:hypothetical protein
VTPEGHEWDEVFQACHSPSAFASPVRRGVSKGVEEGRRPPALRTGYPKNGHMAVSGVARLQGVEGLGEAGPGVTLGSPWIPLTIRLFPQPLVLMG